MKFRKSNEKHYVSEWEDGAKNKLDGPMRIYPGLTAMTGSQGYPRAASCIISEPQGGRIQGIKEGFGDWGNNSYAGALLTISWIYCR